MISWSDDLAIGIPDIDQQHRAIFEQMARLEENLEKDCASEVSAEVVDFLAEYVVEHFSTEEKLMKEIGYPEYSYHKSEHATFLDKFYQIRSLLNQNDKLAKYYLHSVMANWLTHHIANEDQKLSPYLR